MEPSNSKDGPAEDLRVTIVLDTTCNQNYFNCFSPNPVVHTAYRSFFALAETLDNRSIYEHTTLPRKKKKRRNKMRIQEPIEISAQKGGVTNALKIAGEKKIRDVRL